MENELDKRIEAMLDEELRAISAILEADILYYYGEINSEMEEGIRKLLSRRHSDRLALVMTTSGGAYDAAEMIIDDLRHYHDDIQVILPDGAMSAGTVIALSGDTLFMNYASNLGPIDSQTAGKEGLRPCDGYARFGRELLNRKLLTDMTLPEYTIYENLDIARIFDEENMAKLPIDILTKTLNRNILKNGTQAKKIAEALADRSRWLTHGRPIRPAELRDMGIIVKDYSTEPWSGRLDSWHEMEKTYLRYKDRKGILAHGCGTTGVERIAFEGNGGHRGAERADEEKILPDSNGIHAMQI